MKSFRELQDEKAPPAESSHDESGQSQSAQPEPSITFAFKKESTPDLGAGLSLGSEEKPLLESKHRPSIIENVETINNLKKFLERLIAFENTQTHITGNASGAESNVFFKKYYNVNISQASPEDFEQASKLKSGGQIGVSVASEFAHSTLKSNHDAEYLQDRLSQFEYSCKWLGKLPPSPFRAEFLYITSKESIGRRALGDFEEFLGMNIKTNSKATPPKVFSMHDWRGFLGQMLLALESLFVGDLVHRDVKFKNFLVYEVYGGQASKSKFRIKLADLNGVRKIYPDGLLDPKNPSFQDMVAPPLFMPDFYNRLKTNIVNSILEQTDLRAFDLYALGKSIGLYRAEVSFGSNDKIKCLRKKRDQIDAEIALHKGAINIHKRNELRNKKNKIDQDIQAEEHVYLHEQLSKKTKLLKNEAKSGDDKNQKKLRQEIAIIQAQLAFDDLWAKLLVEEKKKFRVTHENKPLDILVNVPSSTIAEIKKHPFFGADEKERETFFNDLHESATEEYYYDDYLPPHRNLPKDYKKLPDEEKNFSLECNNAFYVLPKQIKEIYRLMEKLGDQLSQFYGFLEDLVDNNFSDKIIDKYSPRILLRLIRENLEAIQSLIQQESKNENLKNWHKDFCEINTSLQIEQERLKEVIAVIAEKSLPKSEEEVLAGKELDVSGAKGPEAVVPPLEVKSTASTSTVPARTNKLNKPNENDKPLSTAEKVLLENVVSKVSPKYKTAVKSFRTQTFKNIQESIRANSPNFWRALLNELIIAFNNMVKSYIEINNLHDGHFKFFSFHGRKGRDRVVGVQQEIANQTSQPDKNPEERAKEVVNIVFNFLTSGQGGWRKTSSKTMLMAELNKTSVFSVMSMEQAHTLIFANQANPNPTPGSVKR